MGVVYTSLVGAPPDPRTRAFRDWKDALIAARIAEIEVARAATYHYSQSGDDTTGDGSIGNPWKSIAKANAQISAGSGDEAHLFRRGDVWEETVGVVVTNRNGITIGAYGDPADPKPLFNRFLTKYTSGWTLVGGRHERSESAAVAWIRDANNRIGEHYSPPCFRKMDSAAAVEETNWSFWHDSETDTLHIRLDGVLDPNDFTIEMVEDNTSAQGVSLSSGSDNCLVEDIRADGHGITDATGATQIHGIQLSANGTNAQVARRCESYYNASHNMQHSHSGTGGIGTWVECKVGFTRFNGVSGETQMNAFCNNGGMETIWERCEAIYGTLPQHNWYNPTGARRRGQSFFSHTVGGTTMSLYLTNQCIVRDRMFGSATGAMPSNLLDPSGDVTAVRGWIVEETIEGGVGTGNGHSLGRNRCMRINCRAKFDPRDDGVLSLWPAALNGWCVNCLFEVDLSNCSNEMTFVNRNPATDNALQWWHCTFDIRNNAALFRFDRLNGSVNMRLFNSIVQRPGTPGGEARLFGANNTTAMVDNAFFGFVVSGTPGYDESLRPITLEEPHPIDQPLIGSESAAALVEYDINWMARSASGAQSLGVISDIPYPPPEPEDDEEGNGIPFWLMAGEA